MYTESGKKRRHGKLLNLQKERIKKEDSFEEMRSYIKCLGWITPILLTLIIILLFFILWPRHANAAFWDYSYQVTNTVSTPYTIGTDDWKECFGGIIYVEGATTVTACDNLQSGMNFTILTNAGDYAVSLDTQSDNLMYLDGVALDNGDKATNQSTNGDIIKCNYRSTTTWVCTSGSLGGTGVWTDGGP